MTEIQAAQVAELNTKLVLTKKLMQNECRASVPDNYLDTIKQLVAMDEDIRTSFYKVMKALGEKYNKQYRAEIAQL